MNNNIVYNGNVKVTIKKGSTVISKQTISNNGTNILFRALCLCLCGDNTGLSSMPMQIDGGSGIGSSFVSLLQTPSLITRHFTVYDSSTGSWKAQFIATISYAQLNKQGVPITSLQLLSMSNDILAEITYPANEGILIEGSTYTAIVEWDMWFTNVVSQ